MHQAEEQADEEPLSCVTKGLQDLVEFHETHTFPLGDQSLGLGHVLESELQGSRLVHVEQCYGIAVYDITF